MLMRDRQAAVWRNLYETSRQLALRLPLLRRAGHVPAVNAIRLLLAEHAVAAGPDRIFMERTILPTLAGRGFGRILFVGSRRYTSHYGRVFRTAGSDYWTMDIDPAARRWGEPGRHLVGSVLQADRLFVANSFDLVLLNGVFGFGVDDVPSMEQTLRALRTIMKPDAILLVGWNEGLIPDPAGLRAMTALFCPTGLGPIPPRHRFTTGCRHVYDLYSVA